MLNTRKTVLLISVLASACLPALAIDVAIPSDMYEYEWSGQPDLVEPGLIITALWSNNLITGVRYGYAVAFNETGDIVFYQQNERNRRFSHWSPQTYQNRHIYSIGKISYGSDAVILDSSLVPVDTVFGLHPDQPGRLDLHEIIYDEAGNLWSIWIESRIYDLSQYIQGGHPECLVRINFIQQWDQNGNVLWSWNGHDHLDELPFMANDDTTNMYDDRFDHLHANSISIAPDGNVLLSFRNMSIIVMIDYDTGNVLWRMGGGQANDFTFIGNDNEHPLDFNRQHDAKIFDDGHITVFDNGNNHPLPRSYGRDYILDLDSMTAELTYCYAYPETSCAEVTGNYQTIPGGHRLLGWGAAFDIMNITEINDNDEIVWEIYFGDHPSGLASHDYRAYKIPSIGPAAVPYLSDVIDYDNHQIELVCNWWGHHEEVEQYEIWWGEDVADQLMGTTDTGYFYITDYTATEIYCAKIRALDTNGNVISEFSREIEVNTNPLSVPDFPADDPVPHSITLAPAYPNPFNSYTNVNVNLPEPAEINLHVFDILGRSVSQLYQGGLRSGRHSFTFDARELSSGMYFIYMAGPEGVARVRRVTLIK